MCNSFEKDVGLSVPETLWQVLMEKEFQDVVKSLLLATESCSQASASNSSSTNRTLSTVESNAAERGLKRKTITS